MKKKMLKWTLILALLLPLASTAQVRLHVNINIGSQPEWGPAGYDYAEYYYIPDMDAYYYVPARQFVYLQGRNWVFSYTLPPAYAGFDLYHCYKVVINEPNPWLRHDRYYGMYHVYAGRRDQRYNRIDMNWNHRDRNYMRDRDDDDHDRGRHRGWENGRGRGHGRRF